MRLEDTTRTPARTAILAMTVVAALASLLPAKTAIAQVQRWKPVTLVVEYHQKASHPSFTGNRYTNEELARRKLRQLQTADQQYRNRHGRSYFKALWMTKKQYGSGMHFLVQYTRLIVKRHRFFGSNAVSAAQEYGKKLKLIHETSSFKRSWDCYTKLDSN